MTKGSRDDAPGRQKKLNSAPSALDDTLTDVTIADDQLLRIPVQQILSNDSDPDGDALTISALTGAYLDGNDVVVTTPITNGSTSFSYTIEDGRGGTDNAVVTVGVNYEPDAIDDTFSDAMVGDDMLLRFAIGDLLANDSDSDGDMLTISALLGAYLDGQTVVVTAPVVNGMTQFSYTVADGRGGVDTADVVASVNTRPVAQDDTFMNFWTGSDQLLRVAIRDILANDTDADGDHLFISALSGAYVDGDSVVVTSPFANGATNFTYEVSDGRGGIDTASVTVTTATDPGPANSAPVATTDVFLSQVPDAQGNLVFDVGVLISNDLDADGDNLSISAVQGAFLNGQSVVVTPQMGVARFTYEVTDGKGGIATGEVVATTDMHMNPHPSDSSKSVEHAALMDLVPHSEATHVAVRSGAWSDPATWANGIVPDDGAKVLILSDVDVTYDVVSDARIFTVRVDGTLDFARDQDTKMVVDTMVVSMSGTLSIGSEDDPIPEGVSAEIVIANNGAIDVAWDPMLLSRGLISHGTTEIHGSETLAHTKVVSDPMAGDVSIALSEVPIGWGVGDKIVIAGTEYEGYNWDNGIRATRHFLPEDEVRTISKVVGNVVYFDEPLVHDHDAPRSDLKTSVANYSRSVTISTENHESAAVHERGHVMFMHSNDVDVRYAAFEGLGRTDKSQPSDGVTEFSTVSFDTNVQGRYSLHVHQSGLGGEPAMLVGNAVYGSPGWGIVHHDSNAELHFNATYDTFGAGYVAETGNEVGTWANNIAIYAKGVSWDAPKNQVDLSTFDTANGGDGFWFQSRMVDAFDNIAASTNHGFTYFHRDGDGGTIGFGSDVYQMPDALGNLSTVGGDKPPILGFDGNEAFASNEGLHIVKAGPNQNTDLRSVLSDFTAWNVLTGAHLEYTAKYTLQNFDLVARDPIPFQSARGGIEFGTNSSDVIVVGATIDGFKTGIALNESFTWTTDDATLRAALPSAILDTTFLDITGEQITGFVTGVDTLAAGVSPSGAVDVTFNAPLTYFEGHLTPGSRMVAIDVTKADSLGSYNPEGADSYDAGFTEMVEHLNREGYWTLASGERVTFLDDVWSDRVTGEIFKTKTPVYIDASVPLGNRWFSYAQAVDHGLVDLAQLDPRAQDDFLFVDPAQGPARIDVLANDSDPEGSLVLIDGFTQARFGRVELTSTGELQYTADPGVSGVQDAIKYWVTDGHGGLDEAWLFIDLA